MKYWVDFNGYGWVEAENEREAEKRFWDFVQNVANGNGIIMDDVWDLDGIEEKTDDVQSDTPVTDATPKDWTQFWEYEREMDNRHAVLT